MAVLLAFPTPIKNAANGLDPVARLAAHAREAEESLKDGIATARAELRADMNRLEAVERTFDDLDARLEEVTARLTRLSAAIETAPPQRS